MDPLTRPREGRRSPWWPEGRYRTPLRELSKIERAKKHIDDLDTAINDFGKTDFCRLVSQVDPKTNKRYCQLEPILARLDAKPRKKTPEYHGFPSCGSRVLPQMSLKLTIPAAPLASYFGPRGAVRALTGPPGSRRASGTARSTTATAGDASRPGRAAPTSCGTGVAANAYKEPQWAALKVVMLACVK